MDPRNLEARGTKEIDGVLQDLALVIDRDYSSRTSRCRFGLAKEVLEEVCRASFRW